MNSMAPNMLTSSIPIGTLAALLTALEYVLSIASGLSARAAVHGVWLIGLHRGGEADLTGNTRVRRAFIRDLIATILGIWLVTGVALVESNLQSGVLVAENEVNDTLCVSVFGKYLPQRPLFHKPPFRANIEPWILSVSKTIECGDAGIATVGTGGLSDHLGVAQNMSAPVCANRTVDMRGGEVSASMEMLKMSATQLNPKMEKSDGFIIFPHDGSNIGTRIGKLNEGKGPCGERGISGFATALPSHFETVFFHSDNMTKVVHEYICTLHGKRPVVPLPNPSPCISRDGTSINSTCLRKNANQDLLHSVRLTNISALFVPSKSEDASYVCLSASVDYEYVFISPTFLRFRNRPANATLPVIVPTIVKVIDGYCERTIAALGQAALVYTLDAEWRKHDLAKLPRRTRYYAYMMAVSTSMFPLHTLRGKENPRVNGTCLLHPVTAVTEIPVDWRFGILMSGLVLVLLVVIVGFILRMSFSGEVWDVGSAQWSLTRLLGKGIDGAEGQNARIQVVPVESTNISLGHSRTNNMLVRTLSSDADEPATVDNDAGRVRRRAALLPRRRFEYRVHTKAPARGDLADEDRTPSADS